MGGITVDDFTSSVAYREIFGLGHQEGEVKGRQQGLQVGRQEGEVRGRQLEAAALTMRLLKRRWGSMASGLQSSIEALPLAVLEDLVEALDDFQDPHDLTTWLNRHGADKCSSTRGWPV
ncbi:MAG: DUF4351 domain-containing protein [Isosphaeraceae bacterium]